MCMIYVWSSFFGMCELVRCKFEMDETTTLFPIDATHKFEMDVIASMLFRCTMFRSQNLTKSCSPVWNIRLRGFAD